MSINVPPSAAEPLIPGWYGKIPGLGDFARRRLPDPYVQGWDDWLARGIETSRASLGEEAWLDSYLRAPVWRFALVGDWFAGGAWSGVLMPSVDRVGRYFPLTIAAPWEPPSSLEGFRQWTGWLARLHDVALDCLEESYTAESLEAALAACALPGGLPPPEDPIEACVLADFWSRHQGDSLWWCDAQDDVQPLRGLPPPGQFDFLFSPGETRVPQG